MSFDGNSHCRLELRVSPGALAKAERLARSAGLTMEELFHQLILSQTNDGDDAYCKNPPGKLLENIGRQRDGEGLDPRA